MGIFKFGKKRILIAGSVTMACCVLMVAFPSIALASARRGISLWASDVLPALLPFFICANFLQNIGIIRMLRSGAFPFAMSVLSGYPMGAKIVGDLRRGGEISLTEAKRLMSFCSTSGPAFMVGAVGAGMLGSGTLGGIIAAAHYIGALVNGILYTRLLGRESGGPPAPISDSKRGGRGMQESFTDAILMSFRSLAIVLAYIVLFMFLTDLFHMSGLFSMTDDQAVRALIKGFFEMTVGCEAVAEGISVTSSVKCVLCAFILSWGGLSVMGQSMSMLSSTGVTLGYLMVSKLTHGIFAAAAAFLITLFVL
ncbi:MAG: hypothetical protein ACLU7V_06325 [Anaerovoracaceae bacterium]